MRPHWPVKSCFHFFAGGFCRQSRNRLSPEEFFFRDDSFYEVTQRNEYCCHHAFPREGPKGEGCDTANLFIDSDEAYSIGKFIKEADEKISTIIRSAGGAALYSS